ncbi:MAG: hypothetical protein ACR2M0_06625 [Chloroflexia bacterium]
MPDATSASTNILPIRRLTLYKHGVGFVERRGTCEGEEIQLAFRADEVNDTLKSLLALDRGGGQVLGIRYDTPADREARLAESGITLGPDHSLLDLLRGLRGWQVRLTVGEGAAAEQHTGRLLGVEVAEDRPVDRARVALLEDRGVVNLPMARLARVELLEDRALHDLHFFLDTSRTEESHRTVSLRLSPGTHDLAVSYLVPSPTWRVSYRLVAESSSDEGPAGGELVIQGWGLFDNRMEEDLNEVAVTLVAGQPISFIYDLTTSHIPSRRVVEDEARVAPGPVEFQDIMQAADGGRMPAPAAPRMMAALAAPAAAMMSMADLERAAPTSATGADLGELFEYQVTAPVTVKRGESALVPILAARVPYRRRLLYNGAKMPVHPVAALRFTNTTGLVLERGPVTIVEDGDYRGEALVPFTKSGGDVYLAFAVELGIKVTETAQHTTQTAALRIEGAYFYIQQANLLTTTYTCESSLAGERVVTIERPVDPNATLVETPTPDEKSAEFYRWEVVCPPRGAAALTVAERTLYWRQEAVLNQSYDQLRLYLRDRLLDEDTLARIKRLLDERQAIADNDQERARLSSERQEIYARQEQVRQNMAALGTAGEEGALRRKLFTALSASEDRLAAIDARIAALAADSEARQALIDAELPALNMHPRKETE